MDWGRFALGFVGGAANYGANQIQQRQKDEQELKKEKLLMDLRAQTEKDMEVFKHDLTQHDTDARMSGPDLATGKYIYRDSDGNQTSSRDLTETEKKDLQQNLDKGDLEVQNIKSTIASRAHDDALGDQRLSLDRAQTAASIESSRASADNSRASAEYTRASLDGTKNSGLHGSPTGGDPDLAAASKLVSLYKDEVNAMTAKGVSPIAIKQAALALVKNSRTGADADKAFNEWLIRLNTGKTKGISLSP